MPHIYDNIADPLLDALLQALEQSYRADFCVGYLNLRGWRLLDGPIASWPGGEGAQCRVLVGMQRSSEELLRSLFAGTERPPDNAEALRLKHQVASHFKEQLTVGAPTNEDEAGLRRLAAELKTGQVVVKLYLRHPLHAKLYLVHREDAFTPRIGYVGSSNLTLAGMRGQGELNVDVVEQDAVAKLCDWFEERWQDHWALDISEELAQIIDESWAGERAILPYHIYLNMAYHLSREQRAGASQFRLPRRFQDTLLDFQVKAVQLAARHLNQRQGVIIGDVVGLGKTLMATAVAAVFQEDYNDNTLVICPKNLTRMWQEYLDTWGITGRVLSISQVQKQLPDVRRFRLLILDESHNLRNPEGKRYKVIRDYIERNDCRCVLLSATPYNKSYLDLAGQLGLFIDDSLALAVAPEAQMRAMKMRPFEFQARFQVSPHTLAAFRHSEQPDDWRSLMSLYMVRRTRSYIRRNYAVRDDETGRYYLEMSGDRRFFMPERIPLSEHFEVDACDPRDQYAALYSDDVVSLINGLHLPRYGLQEYRRAKPPRKPSAEEAGILDDLGRARRRLMGFSRTNLFKRLESSGHAFLLSVERHILRNYVFLHALENNLALPIGTQGAELLRMDVTLDTRFEDEDADDPGYTAEDLLDDDTTREEFEEGTGAQQGDGRTQADFRARAAQVYAAYSGPLKSRFRWLDPSFFGPELARDLMADAQSLSSLLQSAGLWRPQDDRKLAALQRLVTETYPGDKLLVFSQFADTVEYIARNLRERGIRGLAGVTGQSADPTELARRFSPVSNECADRIAPSDTLRVLIATDVLSEGQNLQDAHIVVNYDLPWAIIRLIQRAGRVDRIGQSAPEILCHSFWPADGVERLLNLRSRLRDRLHENAEVVGSDEVYFEDEENPNAFIDIYTGKVGSLDDRDEGEVDLVSEADGIWRRAIAEDPSLEKWVTGLPPVVYATKAWAPRPNEPEGALVYIQTAAGNAALGWARPDGALHSASTLSVLRAAECTAQTPALERESWHHQAVARVAAELARGAATLGGGLGSTRGARYKTYIRLEAYARALRGTLFGRTDEAETLYRAVEQIFRFPLQSGAVERINRQLNAQIRDVDLADLVKSLYEDGRLCQVEEDGDDQSPPVIICSMGLSARGG